MDESDPAPRRRGLGFFPEAVVIRGSPPRYPPAAYLRGGGGSGSDSDESDTPARARPRAPKVYHPHPNSWAVARDWLINPSGHGRPDGRAPPVFVRAEANYDELGRSVIDGFGVDVDTGAAAGDAEKDEGAGDKMTGGAVADWYLSLSRAGSGASTPAGERAKPALPTGGSGRPSRSATPTQVSNRSAFSASRVPAAAGAAAAIAVVAAVPALAAAASPTPPPSAPAPPAAAPLRIARDWFIGRALVASHRAHGLPAPVPAPRPSSIGGMLNISAAKAAPAPLPRYAIGPENVGYARLQGLGWGGGGLGRPEGWAADAGAGPAGEGPAPRPSRSSRGADGRDNAGAGRRATGVIQAGAKAGGDSASGPGGTSSSGCSSGDDDSDSDAADAAAYAELTALEARPRGPGRTAPVATSLKLDRLGLGRAAAPRKVTHTAAEIAAAQRRARGGSRPAPPPGAPPTKRQKVKWAERERRERESRRRIAAALNS